VIVIRRLATRWRRKRAAHAAQLLMSTPRPLRVLDIGGTEAYWTQAGIADLPGLEVTLLNLTVVPATRPNFRSIAGDACDLSAYSDHAFDLGFSNSVIEHVGDFDRQTRMAQEIRRVCRRYYVQTPNRNFLVEPHFWLPLYTWYPRPMKIVALRAMSLLPKGPINNRVSSAGAAWLIDSVRLLTERELRALFPDGRIWKERVGPFAKSLTAYGGWDAPE
jgi:hypothetical protein